MDDLEFNCWTREQGLTREYDDYTTSGKQLSI